MKTRIQAQDVADLVMWLYVDKSAKMVDAALIQSRCLPDVSISTVRRLCAEAAELDLIVNLAHHGARRHWVPTRRALADKIAQLRERT